MPASSPPPSPASAPNPPSFAALSALLEHQPHALALSAGSAELRLASEQALKDVFQLALDSEPTSLPPLEAFLQDLVLQNPSASPSDALPSLAPTPLDALYTDDLGPSEVWQQLELRAAKLVGVLEQFGILADLDDGEADGKGISREEKIARGIPLDSDDEDDEEEDSDGAFDGIDDMPDSDASDVSDDDESPLSDPDAFDGSDFPEGALSDEEEEDDFAGLDYGDEDVSEEEDDEEDDTLRRITDLDAPGSKAASRRSHPTLDDSFFSIDAFNRETEELEALDVTSGGLGADSGSDSDEDDALDLGAGMDAGGEGEGDEEDEEMEGEEDLDALLMSGGPPAPGGDMWARAVDAGDGLGTDEVRYSDFFAPPSKPPSGAAQRAKAKASKAAKGKGKGGKGRAAREEEEDGMELEEGMEVTDEEDEDQEEEDESEDEDEDEGEDGDEEDEEDEDMKDDEEAEEEEEAFGARKGKTDLFADDDETETDAAPLSTHAKRLAALSSQIAALEAENAGPKQWARAGEASARARPLNAVLEEDLEFDTVGKQVPLVTEEKVKNLEEKIKQRILENNYNDVERRRPLDAKPFLPSRVFELSDEKSTRSLAQIYEDEYTASAARAKGGKAPLGEKDAKLQKEHDEIEQAWDEICYKLDALSNANFTPKQPKAHIQSISNSASISLESALPPTLRASTLLAPEEVFNPPSASALVASSELTPAEKKARHGKDKKRKRKHRDQLEAMEGMGGQGTRKRVGTRQAKDDALKTLVKEGKGVTIIGKDAKKFDKQGRRQVANPGGTDRPVEGAFLKL